MKEIFLGYLSKALNLDVEQIAALLYKTADDGKLTEELQENALQNLLGANAKHVATLKGSGTDGKARFDEGHSAGKKEALEKLEKQIREAFKIESKSQGIDLVKEVAAAAANIEADAEKVKLNPVFLARERELQDELLEKTRQYEGEVSALKTQYEREKRVAAQRPEIERIFSELAPVLPSNPTAASNQRSQFLASFDGYDYEKMPDGSVLVKTPDGKRVENAQGHPVRLADLVRDAAAQRFDLAVQEGKGNAGNGGKAASGQSSGTTLTFRDETDFAQKYRAEPDTKKRVEMADAWNAQNAP